ncbi:MAG: hypothetical protein GVY19_03540 [Bacteroidetes bacterium]|jgi:lysophospholipase L1-like esterase|nr:hypothetical protein [Bacteroidota bacterium]
MRLFLTIILTNIILIHGFGQSHYPYDLTNYAFVNYDKNKILFPGDTDSFNSFFQKLDTAMVRGEGKINIVHIGGSHIQADIYTHQLRQRFHDFAQGLNCGRGMVFPYDIANTNNPWNYSVDYGGSWERCRNVDYELTCPLGLTGMAVYTSDSAAWLSFNLDPDSAGEYGFDRLKIFYNTKRSTYKPLITDSLSVKRRQVNHHFGYEEIVFDTTHHQVRIQLEKSQHGDEQLILHGVYFEKEGSGLVYNAIGVNGSRLDSYLKCEYFGDHLKAIETNLVVISIGTNDAYSRRFDDKEYQNNYQILLNRIRANVPEAAILLTVPNDSYLYRRYANPHTKKMQQIIMELATEYNCGVWNFYEIMGGLDSSQKWYLTGMMKPDRVHFNKAGYLFKGDLLFNAFSKAYDFYLEENKVPRQVMVNEK